MELCDIEKARWLEKCRARFRRGKMSKIIDTFISASCCSKNDQSSAVQFQFKWAEQKGGGIGGGVMVVVVLYIYQVCHGWGKRERGEASYIRFVCWNDQEKTRHNRLAII